MKEKFKLISIVLILVIFLYFVLDYFLYKTHSISLQRELKKENIFVEIPAYYTYFFKNYGETLSSFKKKYVDGEHPDFRKSNISNEYTKPSIIIFGCSFAYGSYLNDEETFSAKLSKYTKRNVFNRALSGCGIQHMFYFLQDKNFFNHITPEPEYVVYVYIENQIERLNATIFPHSIFRNGTNLRYELVDNKLSLKKDIPFVDKSFLLRKIILLKDSKLDITSDIMKENNSELAVKLFVESKKKLQEKYPDIKFVILKYNYDYYGVISNYKEVNIEDASMWKKLEEQGFIVINTNDILGFDYTKEYTAEDKYHPNSRAWDLLVPKLSEKLGL